MRVILKPHTDAANWIAPENQGVGQRFFNIAGQSTRSLEQLVTGTQDLF